MYEFVYGCTIISFQGQKITPSYHCVSADFYATLAKDNTKLFGYVEENDLTSFEKIFIPVREANNWSLVGVNLTEHHLELYDSSGQKGEEVVKNIQKFFKDVSKFSKKERGRKTIVHKKVDNLKLVQETDIFLQKKASDSGIFVMWHVISLVEQKPLKISNDTRSKVAHKLIEMMQYVKPLETNVLRELGTLADKAISTEFAQEKEEEKKEKKKKGRGIRKTLAPGAIQAINPDSGGDGRKRKGSH